MCEMLIRTRVPSVCCCGLSCGVTHGTPVDGAGSPCPAGALRPRVGHSCLDVMVCRSSRGRRPRQRTFRQEPPREGPPPPLPIPHWSITERVEQHAHGLELQAGFAPQPRTGPYGHLALEAAHGRQARTHGADAGDGELGTGGEATGGPRPRLLFRRSSAAVAGVA